MKIFSKLIGGATKITERFGSKVEITEICQRVYHCPYPSDANALHSTLKSLNPENISICNLSEYPYSKELRQKLEGLGFEISQLTFEFYSSMPLTTAITLINKMHAFLRGSERNVVLVHCQENKSRSVLLLSAYLYLSGKVSDIATALATVNQKLGINRNETVYSSQHALLRNIANYHKDPSFINRDELKLVKLIINEAPKIPDVQLAEEEPLQILVEIRRNGTVIYRKVTKQFGQGQIVQFNLKDENITLADDCLFSFKYVHKEKIYPVMRIQLNTNFVFNCFVRVPRQEIDFCKNVQAKGHVFTDFLFLAVKGRYSELSQLEGHLGVTVEPIKKQAQLSNQSKESNLEKPQDEGELFNINDDEKQKQEFDEKLAEEKLNKLLVSMAMKKAEVQDDIKQAEEGEEQQEEAPASTKKQQKETKQEQIEVKNIQNIKKQEQKKGEEEKKEEKEKDEDDLDMDDYLNRLEEQAQQH